MMPNDVSGIYLSEILETLIPRLQDKNQVVQESHTIKAVGCFFITSENVEMHEEGGGVGSEIRGSCWMLDGDVQLP